VFANNGISLERFFAVISLGVFVPQQTSVGLPAFNADDDYYIELFLSAASALEGGAYQSANVFHS